MCRKTPQFPRTPCTWANEDGELKASAQSSERLLPKNEKIDGAVLVFLLLTGCARRVQPGLAPAQLTLASFNIRILSTASRTDAELARMAEIVQPYDLLAIQEVRDEPVVQRLTALLRQQGLDYSYVLSSPVGHVVTERYAFIYRPDRVHPLTQGALYPDPQDIFIREPFVASFSAGAFDFTLATIHVLFGSSLPQRRAELTALATSIRPSKTAIPRNRT